METLVVIPTNKIDLNLIRTVNKFINKDVAICVHLMFDNDSDYIKTVYENEYFLKLNSEKFRSKYSNLIISALELRATSSRGVFHSKLSVLKLFNELSLKNRIDDEFDFNIKYLYVGDKILEESTECELFQGFIYSHDRNRGISSQFLPKLEYIFILDPKCKYYLDSDTNTLNDKILFDNILNEYYYNGGGRGILKLNFYYKFSDGRLKFADNFDDYLTSDTGEEIRFRRYFSNLVIGKKSCKELYIKLSDISELGTLDINFGSDLLLSVLSELLGIHSHYSESIIGEYDLSGFKYTIKDFDDGVKLWSLINNEYFIRDIIRNSDSEKLEKFNINQLRKMVITGLSKISKYLEV